MVLAIASVILPAAPAFAHGGRWHGGGGLAILHSLGLTDAQKTQVHQIFTNHRPKFHTFMTQLRTAQQQLADKLYGAGTVTEADVAPLAQQVNQLRDQLSQERLAVAMEIRSVLTPDQIAKAAQIHQQLDQLRAQRRALMHPGQ